MMLRRLHRPHISDTFAEYRALLAGPLCVVAQQSDQTVTDVTLKDFRPNTLISEIRNKKTRQWLGYVYVLHVKPKKYSNKPIFVTAAIRLVWPTGIVR